MVACLRFTVSSQLDVPCRWQATAVGKSGEDYERPNPSKRCMNGPASRLRCEHSSSISAIARDVERSSGSSPYDWIGSKASWTDADGRTWIRNLAHPRMLSVAATAKPRSTLRGVAY